MYDVTLRRVRIIIVTLEKIAITYSKCLSVALGIQRTILMRHIVIYVHGQTNGHSDMTKSTVPFHNFEIALKNRKIFCIILSVLYNQ